MLRSPRTPAALTLALLLLAVSVLTALAQPNPPYLFPTAAVLGTATNCGVTNIIGYFEDAAGNPVNGITARVRTTGGGFTALSNLSVGGAWDFALASGAVAGDWQVWADVGGVQQSPVINIHTDGPDRCGPNNPGVQTVWVKISGMAPASGAPQTGAAPDALQPQLAPPPAPQPQGSFAYPNAAVVETQSSCGGTGFRGRVLDPNGNGIPGITIRIQSADGQWTALSNFSGPAGEWDLGISGAAIAGSFLLSVEPAGVRQSPAVPIGTNGPDRCNPGSGGVQQVTINFAQ